MKEKWNFEKENEKIEKTLTGTYMWDKKWKDFTRWNYLSLILHIYIILFLQHFFVFYITNITQYIVDDKFLC